MNPVRPPRPFEFLKIKAGACIQENPPSAKPVILSDAKADANPAKDCLRGRFIEST